MKASTKLILSFIYIVVNTSCSSNNQKEEKTENNNLSIVDTLLNNNTSKFINIDRSPQSEERKLYKNIPISKEGTYKIKKRRNFRENESLKDYKAISNDTIKSLLYSLQTEVHKRKTYGGSRPLLEITIVNNLTKKGGKFYTIYKSQNAKYYFYHNHYIVEINNTKLLFDYLKSIGIKL